MKRPIALALIVVVVLAAVLLYLRSRGGDKSKDEPVAEEGPRRPAGPMGRGDRGQGPEMTFLNEDDPEGTLRLEGQVIDADEIPVGGANVILGSNPPRMAVSEKDGSFFFDKLVARRYRLQARAERGVAGPITARLSATSEPVILRLRPAATVKVTVVRATDKSPVDSATVELRGMDVQSEQTDVSGVAMIAPVGSGRYSIVAHAPGFAPSHSFLRVPAGAATTAARLELSGGAAVSGRVVSPEGAPVEGASVVYTGASDWAQRADPRHDAVATDAEGRFAFPALPPGSFRFVARHDVHAPGTSDLVTLDGATETSGVEIRLQQGGVIRGKVVSTENAPVPSSRVRIAIRVEGMRWVRPRQTFSDESGEFEIGALPLKEHQLIALHEVGNSEIAEVDLSKGPVEREVTLTLDVLGKISGIVVDPDDEPIEGAQVSARPAGGRGFGGGGGRAGRSARRLRGRQTEVTDAGGRFELSGLEPGEYEVRASPAGTSRRRGRDRRREPVIAETGDTDVRIVLTPDGGIKGKVTFKDGKAPEMFSVATSFRGGTPFANQDGSFQLDDLPPQAYNLRITGAGFDSRDVREVEVKEGEITDVGTIEVHKGRMIAGRVTANGSPVEGATVLVGARLFGSGSSSQMGGGRMPMAQTTKEDVTDERGEFAVHGVGLGDLAIVAEHDQIGRSPAFAVRGTRESVADLELALLPFGALEGIVTKAGQPVESSRISVQAKTVPDAIYAVRTGADGKFRFDKLAPDDYKVSAVAGRGRHGAMAFHSASATVKPGETATVSIVVDSGQVELLVTAKPTTGTEINFAQINAVRGEIEARNARELELAVAAAADAYSVRGLSIRGNPARLRELAPGGYTVCATAFPLELTGMMDSFSYLEREGGNLAVFCKRIAVTEAPAEQSVQIEVEIPKFVPPPNPE